MKPFDQGAPVSRECLLEAALLCSLAAVPSISSCPSLQSQQVSVLISQKTDQEESIQVCAL